MNIQKANTNIDLDYCKLELVPYEQEISSTSLQYETLKSNNVVKLDKSTNVNWLSDLFYSDIDIRKEYSVTIQEISVSSDSTGLKNYVAENDQNYDENIKEDIYFAEKLVTLQNQIASNNHQLYNSNDCLNTTISQTEDKTDTTLNYTNVTCVEPANINEDTNTHSNLENVMGLESPYVQHITIQSDEDMMYTCVYCEKHFYRKDYLTRHERTHASMKIYTCDSCQKQFRNRTHLKRHMIIHTSEKPYTCECCHRKFNRKDNLNAHIKKTHTKEKNR